ncbi:MAG: HAD family hydrolase [Geobacter sp.]|nr:HAD family hydrolase [Geobacter sp.]
MMDGITTIIFDLDGTLYCSKPLADEIHRVAVDGLSQQLGMSTAETDARLAAAKSTLAGSSSGEVTLSAACQELGGDIRQLHYYLAEQVVPEPFLTVDSRVIAMLGRLKADYALYIYTNNNRRLADRIMRAIGVDEFFAGIFSVEDFWRSKPDRLALAKLFAAIGAEPAECLFVGDRFDVDLRLPEEHGSRVLLTKTIEELLSLEKLCQKEID